MIQSVLLLQYGSALKQVLLSSLSDRFAPKDHVSKCQRRELHQPSFRDIVSSNHIHFSYRQILFRFDLQRE
jgi:hypothetical protein